MADDGLRRLRAIRHEAYLLYSPDEAKMPLEGPEIFDEAKRAAIELAISDCVQRFYAKGVAVPLIGPVFTSTIPDLPAHLEIIKNFWQRSLLGTERYQCECSVTPRP